jgi:hypothetical protein
MAAITVVYGLVVWFAPGFVANLVGVSPVLSASSVASVAGAVRGAVSQAAGGFGSFGRAADAGAKNAVAAASAIRARIGK